MSSLLERFVRKPKLAILVDRPNWAYDFFAHNVRDVLSDQFDIDIYYVTQSPVISPEVYDLLHVCFWGETYHHKFNFPPSRVVKEVSSHRWQFDAPYGPIKVQEFVNEYLSDANTVVATSLALYDLLQAHSQPVYHVQNGFDPTIFSPNCKMLKGPIQIAWCGNAADPVKGVDNILKPSALGYSLRLATGNVPQNNLAEFYRQSDVYVVCSVHEAEPLTLIEAMACGCFPVCCQVGIVPELVRHKENGYIVSERSVEAFAEAFSWCAENLHDIRAKRQNIARELHATRTWSACAQTYQHAWEQALKNAFFPVFRNDDVAPDTDVASFKIFCNIFHSNGFSQIHAVTLSGFCNVEHDYGGVATEYAKLPPICYWKNEDIRRASYALQMEDCKDLVAYLNSIDDELAFHGTAHFDFSQMSEAEQDIEFTQGIERMKHLFPYKKVRFFVPPFNRVNEYTDRVAARHGLIVMRPDGVHLEERLGNIEFFTHTEYRYHHHRFYPQSRFDYYDLTLDALSNVLNKKVSLFDFETHNREGRINKFAKVILSVGRRIGRKIKHTNMYVWAEYSPQNFWGVPLATISRICRESGAPEWHVYAYRYFEKRAFTFDLLRWMVCNLPKNLAIFEAGCGTGQNLFALSKWGFANLTGIDIDPGACLACNRLQEHLGFSMITIETGELFAHIDQERYDFIFSLDVLYLIQGNAYAKFLQWSKKKLNKKGYVAFDVIDKAFEFNTLHQFCTQDWHIKDNSKRPSEYLSRYTLEEIEMLAADNGYKIVDHKFYVDRPQRSVYIMQLL